MQVTTFKLHKDWIEELDDNEPEYSRADEFYFHIGESFYEEEEVLDISVCSIWHWNKHKCLDDRSIATTLMEKLGFPELAESTYESTLSVEDTRQRLLDAGLKENKKFSNFLENFE